MSDPCMAFMFNLTAYLEGHGYLDKPLHHLSLGQEFTFLLFESMIKVATFTETHHNVQLAVISFPRLPVCHNVRMSQLRQKLRLLLCSTPFSLGGGDQIQLLNNILGGEEKCTFQAMKH